jgi:hypothetical protein
MLNKIDERNTNSYDWLIDHFSTNELVNTVSIVPTIELDQNRKHLSFS